MLVSEGDRQWLKIFHTFALLINEDLGNGDEYICQFKSFDERNNLAIQLTYAFHTEKFSNGELNEKSGALNYTDKEIEEFLDNAKEDI